MINAGNNIAPLPMIDVLEISPRSVGPFSLRRARCMELIVQRLERFDSMQAHEQVAAMFASLEAHDGAFAAFWGIFQTALRRGDHTMLGRLISLQLDQWRQAHAEGQTDGM